MPSSSLYVPKAKKCEREVSNKFDMPFALYCTKKKSLLSYYLLVKFFIVCYQRSVCVILYFNPFRVGTDIKTSDSDVLIIVAN